MFKAIVHFSIQKKLFVGLTTLFLLLGGVWSLVRIQSSRLLRMRELC